MIDVKREFTEIYEQLNNKKFTTTPVKQIML